MTSIIPYSDEKLSEIEEKSLKELRALIDADGDPLLVNNKVETTDFYLLIFLRCRQFDVESAFSKMKRVMEARKIKYTDVFDTLYPSNFYKVFDTRGGGVLKTRDPHGRLIAYFKIDVWDPDLIDREDIVKAIILVGTEMVLQKQTQLNGAVILIDTRGLNLKQARQASPFLIHKYLDLYLHANPAKIKAVHICYGSRLVTMMLSFAKKFLPAKLKKSIHVHGNNMSSLHEHISPDILPDIFGGNLTEAEAINDEFRLNMYTQEREDYYKSFIQNIKNL